MIYGLTHSKDNVPLQRLAVAYKVSIGIPAAGGKNYPEKLDHFRIVSKNEKGDWVEDREITTILENIYTQDFMVENVSRRTKLREFDIVFLKDPIKVVLPDGTFTWNLDPVFMTQLAWWAASERKCFGDGLKASRSVTALPEKDRPADKSVRYVEWDPCGDNCPQMVGGQCKPTGVLSFLLRDNPMLGAIAQFKTTSYESIARIGSSLMQVADATGGRLKGIPFKMVLRSGKTSYEQGGQKKSGMAYFVNIEFREQDYKRLMPRLMEESATYSASLHSARMLTERIDDDAIDAETGSEQDRAGEMTSEFYPDNREDNTGHEEKTVNPVRKEFELLGLNAAQFDACTNTFNGDKDAAAEWFGRFSALALSSKKTKQQISDLFSRALLQPGAMEQMFVAGQEQPTSPGDTKRPRGRPVGTTKTQAAPDQAAVPAVAPTPNVPAGPVPAQSGSNWTF